jgi:hypothetical protein
VLEAPVWTADLQFGSYDEVVQYSRSMCQNKTIKIRKQKKVEQTRVPQSPSRACSQGLRTSHEALSMNSSTLGTRSLTH